MGICCGPRGFIGGRNGNVWERTRKEKADSQKGMTERKATATAKTNEEADSQRE